MFIHISKREYFNFENKVYDGTDNYKLIDYKLIGVVNNENVFIILDLLNYYIEKI